MKPIKYLIPFVFLLLVCFQNCGLSVNSNVSGLSQSLGLTTGGGIDTTGIKFPVSWSTDTGNVKKEDQITLENLAIFADSICIVYGAQLQVEKFNCKDTLLNELPFYNSITSSGKINSLSELDSLIGQELLMFDTLSAEQCLYDINANSGDLNAGLKGDESRDAVLAAQLINLNTILSSNNKCNVILFGNTR